MTIQIGINGQNYDFPSVADEAWGELVNTVITTLAQTTLQKAGGTFTLTSDVSFGVNYGLVSKYFKSLSSNIAQSGVVRLAKADGIVWRNDANSGDNTLVTSTDRLQYNGKNIPTEDSSDTFTNKSIDADTNTITDLEVDNFKAGVVDTDPLMAADSDTKVATQKAVKAYIDAVNNDVTEVFQANKEPTGFADPENLTLSYDSTARTMTLTHSSGTVTYFIDGVKYTTPSPWVSSAHSASNGTYFLSINSSKAAVWDTSFPGFSSGNVYVAVAVYQTSYKFGLRECHGLMPWQAWKEFHETTGTYRTSGGSVTPGTFVINSGNLTDVTPGVDLATIADEDLPTTIAACGESSYTRAYFDTGAIVFSSGTTPYMNNGTNIQYNQNPLSGTALTAMTTNNRWVNTYGIFIPVTSDAESQGYRVIWLMGQQVYTTEAAALAEDFRSLSLGNFASVFPEFVPYIRLTYVRTNSAPTFNAHLSTNPTYITGTRSSLVTVAGFTPTDHSSLTGRSSASQHPASAIDCTPTGNLVATDVDSALAELQGDIDSKIAGPGTVVDNRLLKTNGTTGTLVSETGITVDDSDNILTNGSVGDSTTGAILVPVGTSAQRPTGAVGKFRFNTTLGQFEGYDGNWAPVGGSGGLTVTAVDHSDITLVSGKLYLMDLSGAGSGTTTAALPTGSVGAMLQVKISGNQSSGRLVKFTSASQNILWEGTVYDDVTAVIPEDMVMFAWDDNDSRWIVSTSQSVISGNLYGDLTITGKLFIPNKFYYFYTTNGGAADSPFAETLADNGNTNFRVQVPVTGIYRVNVQFHMYTGTSVGDFCLGRCHIKTGPNSSYSSGSNTYRLQSIVATAVNTAGAAGRGQSVTSAMWTGALSANDYVMFGATFEDLAGSGNRAESFTINVEQIG